MNRDYLVRDLPLAFFAATEDAELKKTFRTEQKHLAMYIADLALIEYWTLSFEPSRIAAACLYLSRCMLHIKPEWCDALVKVSGYAASELIPAVHMIAAFMRKANKGKLTVSRLGWGVHEEGGDMRCVLSASLPPSCALVLTACTSVAFFGLPLSAFPPRPLLHTHQAVTSKYRVQRFSNVSQNCKTPPSEEQILALSS